MIFIQEGSLEPTLCRSQDATPFFTEFPFRAFEDALSRLLTVPNVPSETAGNKPWTPGVDIRETENELILRGCGKGEGRIHGRSPHHDRNVIMIAEKLDCILDETIGGCKSPNVVDRLLRYGECDVNCYCGCENARLAFQES